MALLYAQLQIVEEEELDVELEEAALLRRNLRDAQYPFGVSETEFVANFRLNKEACRY